MKKLVIILDSAHGIDTPGKRSPDGTHLEYKWSRMIVEKLAHKLKLLGYKIFFTNTWNSEIGLSNRVKNAQKVDCYSNQTKLLISLHNNAAQGEGFQEARGVEIFTSPNRTYSDVCASEIMKEIQRAFPLFKIRADYSDGDIDKEEKFTILMGSGYSAVLLEWLFQNNKEDLKLLKDESTNKLLIDSLVNAINNLNKDL